MYELSCQKQCYRMVQIDYSEHIVFIFAQILYNSEFSQDMFWRKKKTKLVYSELSPVITLSVAMQAVSQYTSYELINYWQNGPEWPLPKQPQTD